MFVYTARLTLHESVFFATREAGRLYETGRYLHNYALTYALGLAVAPYYHAEQRPRYAEQLRPLNEQGVYVTPALGLNVEYALATFKYANNAYHVEMMPGSKNTPSFGRAKEIAVNSVFEFVILAEQANLRLPRWVRLGLWRSKALVEYERYEAKLLPHQTQQASLPLNPLDIPVPIGVCDVISMPPSSLVDHALMTTDWWMWKSETNTWQLPVNLKYTFPEELA